MSPIVLKGLAAITASTNLTTGLTHPNDRNAAVELFVLLHKAGEPLIEIEIEEYAVTHGWRPDDAKKLARLGAQIASGKRLSIVGGPWWEHGLIERWQVEDRVEAV